MADSKTMAPGPNPSDSKEAVMQALQEGTLPAMTTGDVADRIDFTSKTASSRLKELEDEGKVESGSIGGATAYWLPDDQPVTDGHGGFWGHVPVEGITPTFSAVGMWLAVIGLLFAFAHVLWSNLLTWAVVFLGLSAVAAYGAQQYKDKADPNFTMENFKESLEGDEG